MFSTVIRVLILYLIVLICMRLMGKRAIGELQPFELVIALIIADLATIPMAQHNVPLLKGIIPVITLLIIHFLVALLTKKSLLFRKIVSGKSIVIVNPSGIDFAEMKKLNMTLNDLMEALRQESYVGLDEILYVIVETNGKISIIPKAASSPLTSEDMGITKEETAIPVTIIADGSLLKPNLQVLGVTEERVSTFIQKLCGKDCKYKDLCIFTLDPNGKAYVQKYGEKAISGNVNFKGNEL